MGTEALKSNFWLIQSEGLIKSTFFSGIEESFVLVNANKVACS